MDFSDTEIQKNNDIDMDMQTSGDIFADLEVSMRLFHFKVAHFLNRAIS